MTWTNLIIEFSRIIGFGIKFLDATYNMIINNTLLLCFILMCALFVGLALLKRLIHIN